MYHVSAPENVTVIQTRQVGIVFSVSHKLPFMDSEYDSIKLGPRAMIVIENCGSCLKLFENYNMFSASNPSWYAENCTYN